MNKQTYLSYMAKRGSQLSSFMYGSQPKNYLLLTGRQQRNAVKGLCLSEKLLFRMYNEN